MFSFRIVYPFIFSLFLNGCNKKISNTTSSEPARIYEAPKRELRGVWIATVENIDWPSSRNLDSDKQKEELRKILDAHKKTGINAAFVQVRAASDAFMASRLEPWSEWLTGTQGKAPEPFYDPMEFMIKESHDRGIEFHAWLNLNRAKHKSAKSIAPDNIMKQHPEWFFEFDGYTLYNFGLPEVRSYITRVVVQIVRDYDVDGIHFDDYFYPYPTPGFKILDEETFKKMPRGFNNIADWRRDNIDLLMKQISDGIKSVKPYVKFGVSPFGVWRNFRDDPTGSKTTGGASFDGQFADSKKWIKNGWVDYLAPQIYFTTHFDKVPFESTSQWWTNHGYGRHLYIGLAAYRAAGNQKDPAWKLPNQLPKQVKITRELKSMSGNIYFSSKSLINNNLGFTDSLKNNYYKHMALVPTMPWKDAVAPFPPSRIYGQKGDFGVKIFWDVPKTGERPYKYVVYRFTKNEKPNIEHAENIVAVVPAANTDFTDLKIVKNASYTYIVTSLDRLQNESEGSAIVVVSDTKK